MLDTTLATSFDPGTNVKGEIAGANWTFLLPSLELERIVCFGMPPSSTIVTLLRIGRNVTVYCRNDRHKSAREDASIHSLPGGATWIIQEAGDPLPELDNSVDLAFAGSGGDVKWLANDIHLSSELERVLKADGLIYMDMGGLDGRLVGKKAAESRTIENMVTVTTPTIR